MLVINDINKTVDAIGIFFAVYTLIVAPPPTNANIEAILPIATR